MAHEKDFISQVTKVKNLRIVKCICVLLNVFAYCWMWKEEFDGILSSIPPPVVVARIKFRRFEANKTRFFL